MQRTLTMNLALIVVALLLPTMARPQQLTVLDVQQQVSAALASPTNCPLDLNGDKVCNVLDVQLVIHAVLNVGCRSSIAPFMEGVCPHCAKRYRLEWSPDRDPPPKLPASAARPAMEAAA